MKYKKSKIFQFLQKVIVMVIFFLPIFTFSDETDIGEKAIHSFAKQMRKEKGWFLEGYGGSFCNPEKIKLFMNFATCGKYTRDESRKLLIETAEKFINFVNKHEKYAKIFKDSKFSEENLKLSISFFDKNNFLTKEEGCVADVSLLNENKIIYLYEPENRKGFIHYQEEDESYQEALSIVRKENESLSNQNLQPSLKTCKK